MQISFYEMKQAFHGDFMQPQIVQGRYLDEYEIDGCEHDAAGWYARLSADGFLDCTDWCGPFADPDAAMQYLYDNYVME